MCSLALLYNKESEDFDMCLGSLTDQIITLSYVVYLSELQLADFLNRSNSICLPSMIIKKVK